MRSLTQKVAAPFFAVVLLALTAPAGAKPSPTEATLAREQFKIGVQASKESRFDKAHDAFSRAYELAPTAMILYNLAGSQMKIGRLVASAESYRRFLREATEPPASNLRGAAEQNLAELEKRIGRVALELEGLDAGDTVRLDGDQILSRAVIKSPIPVDPGQHVLYVLRGDEAVIHKPFSVGEGQSTALTIDVPAPPPGADDVAGPTAAGSGEAPPQQGPAADRAKSSGGLHAGWFIAGTIATVGLGAVTLWSGLDTIDQSEAYEQTPTEEGYFDGVALERRTNLFIGITAVAAATTTVFAIFTDWSGDPDEQPAQGSLRVLPAVTDQDGALLITGTF